MDMFIECDLEAIRQLMAESPLHSTYSEDDFNRTIVSAVMHGQCAIWLDKDNNQPKAFMTWAWLNKEAEDGFLMRTRKLLPEDFPRTHIDDQLWVIEIVAPYNNILKTIRETRDILSEFTSEYGCFVRRNQDGSIRKLGYIKSNRKKNEKLFN